MLQIRLGKHIADGARRSHEPVVGQAHVAQITADDPDEESQFGKRHKLVAKL